MNLISLAQNAGAVFIQSPGIKMWIICFIKIDHLLLFCSLFAILTKICAVLVGHQNTQATEVGHTQPADTQDPHVILLKPMPLSSLRPHAASI